jgi:hypothetical protein
MTAARQPRKPGRSLARGARLAPALGPLLVVIGLMLPPITRATAQTVVVNPDTGLAISGFDPLAYFIDHKPELGRSDLELYLGGAIWQFRNEGNRDAFRDHPDVYMPRFGGHDPVAVAHGKMVPGNPRIWAVIGERLYLFYDDTARKTFLGDAGRIIVTADRKWPEITKSVGQ